FLFCPSDPGSHIDDATLGNTGYATTSYGFCVGDWYVWQLNPGPPQAVGPRNRSAFGPNYSRTFANFRDGLSNSIACSEGYIGHIQARDCDAVGTFPSDPTTGTYTYTNIPTPQNSVAALTYLIAQCSGSDKFAVPQGHTRWTN